MDELHAILMKHCKKITIETKCVDNASIEFESYNELMTYSNFNKGRIKRVEITGYNDIEGWNRKLNVTISSEHPKGPSIDCTYHFTQVNEETIFKKEIVDFCEKATKNYVQAIILNWVVLISLFSIPGYFLFHHVSKDWIMSLIFIYGLTIIAAEFFNKFIWAKLFPIVSFSWGESIEYYRKIEKWKNGIFWSVIIAIPVAILANYLFDLLKGG